MGFGERFDGERCVGPQIGADDTSREGVGKVSGYPLCRGAVGGRELGDFRQQVAGVVEIVHGNALGALEEETQEAETGGLGVSRTGGGSSNIGIFCDDVVVFVVVRDPFGGDRRIVEGGGAAAFEERSGGGGVVVKVEVVVGGGGGALGVHD